MKLIRRHWFISILVVVVFYNLATGFYGPVHVRLITSDPGATTNNFVVYYWAEGRLSGAGGHASNARFKLHKVTDVVAANEMLVFPRAFMNWTQKPRQVRIMAFHPAYNLAMVQDAAGISHTVKEGAIEVEVQSWQQFMEEQHLRYLTGNKLSVRNFVTSITFRNRVRELGRYYVPVMRDKGVPEKVIATELGVLPGICQEMYEKFEVDYSCDWLDKEIEQMLTLADGA